jgi:hypothetical protein
MPAKTSAGPNEVVRLEAMRLPPPLPFLKSLLLLCSAERATLSTEHWALGTGPELAVGQGQ